MRAVGIPLAVSCLLLSHTAAAQEEGTEEQATDKAEQGAETAKPAPAPAEDDRFGHRGQIGLRAGLVGGYRMIFRYDESPLCNEFDEEKTLKDQQKFCGHVAPLAIDLGLSYALADSLEPFLWARFGLVSEERTDTDPLVILGVGTRIYTMSDSAFKIFIEPAIGMELEKGSGDTRDVTADPTYDPEYKQDVVFHLAAGPQFDIARNVGIYGDAGITTGILRGIHSNLELQLGVQARVP